jgi:hypothetical protein
VKRREFITLLGGAAVGRSAGFASTMAAFAKSWRREERGEKLLSLHLALLDSFALALCDH